jgi:AAA15 family ATPase/GTPase
MIQRLKIQNFCCFKTVDVVLKPLTILIGKNDTGKSTFLRAIELLSQCGRIRDTIKERDKERDLGFSWLISFYNDYFLLQREVPIHLEAQLEQRISKIIIGKTNLRESSTGFHLNTYNLPASGPQMSSEGTLDLPHLDPLGNFVPSLIDYFLRRDRLRFFEFEKELKTLISDTQDVLVGTPTSERRRLDLKLTSGITLPADQCSVGNRFLLFFLALAYHPAPPEVILIEEPERGLHPSSLKKVIPLLKGLTEGKHSSIKTQIILTTHCPYLLDFINVETDQILVFQKNDAGVRSVQEADKERFKNRRKSDEDFNKLPKSPESTLI